MDEVKLSKLDQLKTAITDFVSTDINELRDSTKKSEFVDNFKTIIKADDSGVYSWLEAVLPFMKAEANKLGITMNGKEEFTPESELEDPTPEEAPVEDVPEDTTEPTPEEVPVDDVKTEGVRMTRGEFLIEVANNFID